MTDLDVGSIEITIDGNAESHNKSRPTKGGGPTFDTVFANTVAAARRDDLKVGIKTFVEECDRLAETYGERFRPNALLREMAAKGQTFYSRFPPKDQKAAAA